MSKYCLGKKQENIYCHHMFWAKYVLMIFAFLSCYGARILKSLLEMKRRKFPDRQT